MRKLTATERKIFLSAIAYLSTLDNIEMTIEDELFYYLKYDKNTNLMFLSQPLKKVVKGKSGEEMNYRYNTYYMEKILKVGDILFDGSRFYLSPNDEIPITINIYTDEDVVNLTVKNESKAFCSSTVQEISLILVSLVVCEPAVYKSCQDMDDYYIETRKLIREAILD